MAGNLSNDPRPEIQIRVNSRRGIVHPVELESARLVGPTSPTPSSAASPGGGVGFREVKHFKKWVPWLIPAFVVANTVMFIISMYVNDCPRNSGGCIAEFLGRFSFQPFKENPLLGPSSISLEKMGALNVNRVVHDKEGWRLLSCNWLHAGVFHILANMLSLLVIGIRLEQEFGFVKVGLLYVISGFGGSLMSALFLQSNISVGASGALFGLLGAMLSELITNWTIYASKCAALITLIFIIAINLAVGILPHVDNFAHIGGFITGFLLGFVFLIRPQFSWVTQRYSTPYTTPNATPGHQTPGYGHSGSTTPLYPSAPTKSRFKAYQWVLWVVSLILVVVGLTAGLVLLLRGVDANDQCSWCHYLSCVPTSRWSCKTEPPSCLGGSIGDQLSLTCTSNNRTRTYTVSNPSSSRIQSLCTQLCR